MHKKVFNTMAEYRHYPEMSRFLIAGVVSNGLGYLLFLFALYVLGMGHKTAFTILFAIGMATNFLINRNWTFGSRGSISLGMLKYIIVYISGYGFNILILAIFVDYLDYSPAWVQLVSFGFLAAYYFLTNKFYIHRSYPR